MLLIMKADTDLFNILLSIFNYLTYNFFKQTMLPVRSADTQKREKCLRGLLAADGRHHRRNPQAVHACSLQEL